jgi:hypothetical protein
LNSSHEASAGIGFYRHYKGHYYQLLAIVRHSEEDAPYALYRALYGDFGLWVRPLNMFCEQVIINGEPIQRFNYLGTAQPADLELPPLALDSSVWPGFLPSES